MSVVVSATAFLLGLLFTHWIADSLTLWKSPDAQSDARLWTAASYYSILSRMSPTLAYIYSLVAVVGGATLLWSWGDLRAGNLMFDGGSVLLYTSAVVMYLYSALPNLLTNFKSLPLPFPNQGAPMASTLVAASNEAAAFTTLPPFPQSLRGPTLELASSHLICSVALTGVVLLQAGRWWAEQQDEDDEEDEEDAEQLDKQEPKEESKKIS